MLAGIESQQFANDAAHCQISFAIGIPTRNNLGQWKIVMVKWSHFKQWRQQQKSDELRRKQKEITTRLVLRLGHRF